MTTIIAGVVGFTFIIMLLVLILMLAKTWLIESRDVSITLNDDQQGSFKTPVGNSLLNALDDQGIITASACGGRGICGCCKIHVLSGGGPILATERALCSAADLRQGVRLACQVKIKQAMSIELPIAFLSARKRRCRVRSNHNVATFIKELVLELAGAETLPFRAGDYIQVECPPCQLQYRDFDIDSRFHARWDQANLWHYHVENPEPTHRSYSLANYPGEKGIIKLNVRIEPPLPDHPEAPPGVVSSYIFGLKPGDMVTVSGPFGELHAKESDAEMLFIGGGAGMAPMRSLIFDQLQRLQTRRKMTFWYGARSLCEAFYQDDFDLLAHQHQNFSWVLALSLPQPEDHWRGARGFIHQIVFDHYLCRHPAPEDIEYYLCGPPPMVDACMQMLEELGVEPENILVDKFG